MPDSHLSSPVPGEPIAIVGMACRFADAANLGQFLELFLTGRRAFRRVPAVRFGTADDTRKPPGLTAALAPDSPPGATSARRGRSGGETAASAGEWAAAHAAAAPRLAAPLRAALIEGWRFDRAAFGVSDAAYQAADPAHWLALETASRALADAGLPGGQGLIRDRTGVVIGNTLTGEVARAGALRSRWPYVRRVLSTALTAGKAPADTHAGVIEHAAADFLSPFPEIRPDSLAGALPGAIADRICGHFGFRGGGHAVDSAHSSSLLSVATACSALAARDLDAALAGGVDISLDPFEIAGLAKAGVLAEREMRVFDARPTGFWPGEGCGLVVLMRAADARAAGVPIYAEIVGWGVSSAGSPALSRPGSGSLLLALRRAYQRAAVDPADVQLIEGDGAGTASGDLAELTSLAEIRAGAPDLAALGSVKANIGHTKAAAGAAGLIKATLAVAAGIIPPTTGCIRPHALISAEDARVRTPRAPEPWPEGSRLAGVSAVGPGGTSVHVVLRRDAHGGRRRRAPGSGRPSPGASARLRRDRPAPAAVATPRTEAFVFTGPDLRTIAAELSRVADLAPWLSDGELHDLACEAARRAQPPGRIRLALVASTQEQLSALTKDALPVLYGLRPGRLATSPGIYAADGGRGRVTLLFPGEGPSLHANARAHGDVGSYDPALQPAALASSLAALRWLDRLKVVAQAGIGHGLGEIAGLVWAGCLPEQGAARLVAQRASLMASPSDPPSALVCVDADARSAQALCRETGLVTAADNGPRCQILAGPVPAVRECARQLAQDGIPARVLTAPAAFYSPAMADRVAPWRTILGDFRFRPPSRRLISTITGEELTRHDDIAALLRSQLTSPVRFAGPLSQAAAEADLLLETGPGESLSLLAADFCDTPTVSLGGGKPDDESAARVMAALFAIGAVESLLPVFAGRPARPIDIWRERTFIANPLGGPQPPGLKAASPTGTRRPPGAATAPRRLPFPPPAQSSEKRAAEAAGQAPEPAAGSGSAAPTASPEPAAEVATEPRADAEPGGGAKSALDPAPLTRTASATAAREAAAPAPASPGANIPNADVPAPPGLSGTDLPGTDTANAADTDPADAADTDPADAARTGPASATPETGVPPTAGAMGAAQADGPPMDGPHHHGPQADSPHEGGPGVDGPPEPEGVAPWVRVFTEQSHALSASDLSQPAGPWRVRLAIRQPFGQMAVDLFPDTPGADCVLAVLADPAEPGGCATLLEAAREAASVGRLVVITSMPGLTGFCASLLAEHPGLGITLIEAPENPAGLRVARMFAAAEPGRLREIRVDDAGLAYEPVMAAALPAADGPFPLGPADVVLVSGVTSVGELACAASMSSRGAALAVIAAPGPEDPRLAAYLSDLRSAGLRVSRKKADPSDPGQVAAAVRSLERALGPVTAVVHAAAPGPIERCAALPEATVRTQLASQRARLANVLAAVAMERVRLLLTFGSVSARYGRREGGCGALLSGLLPGQASRLVSGWPRCRVTHVDWAPWLDAPDSQKAKRATAAAGPPAAAWEVTPIPVSNAWRLLHAVLASPGFPARAAIHGRTGAIGPQAARRAGSRSAFQGRFLGSAPVHYPGIELITETRLSLPRDPYLADHRIDGLLVVPAAFALEAMAQAAGVLAGAPIRRLTGFSAPAPVVLPPVGETILRVCALLREDGVDTVLRCAETGFRVDHARATFHPTPSGLVPAPSPGEPAAAYAGAAGIVDGTDLYGPVYFQTGRFRRVAFLPEVSSRSCRALVRGGDDQPWFGPVAGPVDAPLILGSPGLNDATLHVVQACVPHRRVLPAGCDSATLSGREIRGALQVYAERRPATRPRSPAAPGPADERARQDPSGARAHGADAAGRQARTFGGSGTGEQGRAAPGRRGGKHARPAPESDLAGAPPGAAQPGPGPSGAADRGPAFPHTTPPEWTRAHAGPGTAVDAHTGEPGAEAGAGIAAEVWDIRAVDATGELVSVWQGVRLQDLGPLARTAPWHPALLAVCLEGRAADLGLDTALRVVISSGPQEASAGPAAFAADASGAGDATGSPRPAAATPPPARQAAPEDGVSASSPPGPVAGSGKLAAGSWSDTAAGRGPLDGFALSVQAARPIACAWEAVGPAHTGVWADPVLTWLRDELAEASQEPAATVAARLRAVAECLVRLGREPGAPLVVDDAYDGGWIVVRGHGVTAACAVVEISGVPAPVAVAVGASPAAPGEPAGLARGWPAGRRTRLSPR